MQGWNWDFSQNQALQKMTKNFFSALLTADFSLSGIPRGRGILASQYILHIFASLVITLFQSLAKIHEIQHHYSNHLSSEWLNNLKFCTNYFCYKGKHLGKKYFENSHFFKNLVSFWRKSGENFMSYYNTTSQKLTGQISIWAQILLFFDLWD